MRNQAIEIINKSNRFYSCQCKTTVFRPCTFEARYIIKTGKQEQQLCRKHAALTWLDAADKGVKVIR